MLTDIFDQVAPAQDQQQGGDIFDQVGAQPAQPKPEGFLESLGHTFGIGKEEAAARKQNLEQHPVRTILEDQPPVQAAMGLYHGAKRIGGELQQAYEAGKEGNPAGVAQHAIQATPLIGAGITRGAEQLPAQQGIQNPLTPGVLGTVVGTAAQAAPAFVGGYEGLRSGLASRLSKGAPAAPPAPEAATAPPPAPEVSAPSPEQPGGPSGPGGGPAPAPPEPRPQAGSTGSPVAPQQPAGPATQAAQPGKPTITLEHEPNLLDQVAAHTEALQRARDLTAGRNPADIAALRDAVEETGKRAHDAGDIDTANRAAHADIALSQILEDAIRATNEKSAAAPPPTKAANLNAAAAALTGKPISDVATGKGDIFDQVAPPAPKPVTPDQVAAVLGTSKKARPAVQGSDKPEVIQQSAQEQKPAMQQAAAAAVAGIPGAKVEGVRVKDAESVANKDDRGKAPETITDHLGGRVSAPTPAAVAQVEQNIEQNLPVVGKDQIDNNGLKATQYDVQTGKPGEANQRSELQVVTTDQAQAMKETDELYDKQKEALARGDQAEADRLGAQIKEKFDAAKAQSLREESEKLEEELGVGLVKKLDGYYLHKQYHPDDAEFWKQVPTPESYLAQSARYKNKTHAELKQIIQKYERMDALDNQSRALEHAAAKPEPAAQPESKSKSPQATVDAYRKQFPNTKLTDEEIARDAPNNQKQKEVTVADLYEKHPDLAHDLASRDPGIKEVLDAIVAKTASKENSDAHAGRDNGTPGEGQKDEPQGANGPVRASEAGGAGGSGEAGGKPSVRAGSSEPAAGTAGAGSNQPAAVTPEPSKGARITLNDGRKGTVEWYDRAKKQARIRRDDGKMMPVVPRAGFTLAASNQGEKEEVTPEATGDKWIGVDLDGTLAQYDGFKGKTSIGEPIPAMVARVKQWIADGNNVKILTARVNDDKGGETRKAIQDWTEKHLGKRLEVTDVKDPHMVALYDDRAVSVERNTGALLAQPQPEADHAGNHESRDGGSPSAAAKTKGEGGETDAVRKQGPEGLLQRQPEEDRGGNRGRVQPEQQGNEPAGESRKPAADEEEAKPLGGENGEQGQKAHAADEVKPLTVGDAQRFGAEAFARGDKSVPAHDKAFTAAMQASIKPGSGWTGGLGALFDAWSKGWHAANLAAPVPELKAPVKPTGKLGAKPELDEHLKTPQVAPIEGTAPLGAKPTSWRDKVKSGAVPLIPPTADAEKNALKVQPLSSYTIKPSKAIDKDRTRFIEGSDWISDGFMALDLAVLDPGARRRINKYLPTDDHQKYGPATKKALDDYADKAKTDVESVGWANISLGKDKKGKEMPPMDLALFADTKGNGYPFAFDPSKAKVLIDLLKPDAIKAGSIGDNKNPILILHKKGKPVAVLMGLYTSGRIQFDADTARRTLGQQKERKYKFGNTQADIPPSSDAGKALAELRDSIDPADLMGKGLEKDAHVTVRYGIQGEDTAGIKAFIEQQAPFDATLGPVAKFPPSEHSDGAAPLIAPVESPDLHKLNAEIEKHGDFTEPSFPEYKPHATVAYVKPEAADKYVGDTTTEGATFRVDSIDITDRDGNAETIALKGKQADNKADEEAPNDRPAQPASERPAGGGRKASGTGSPDRERLEPVSPGVSPGSEDEGNAPEGSEGNGPVVRSGSGRLPKPRPRRGSGQGSDTGLDNSPGGLVAEEAEDKAKRQPKRNKDWYEHPQDWHPPAGALTRLDNNLAALEILRDIEKNPRKITDEEKAKLAGYVGWGALSRVFDENYLKKSEEEEHPERFGAKDGYDYDARRWLEGRKETPAYRKERERWREANKKLRELLTPDEYKEAEDSTINAHYTSPELVRFMWDAVKRMGFKSGNVLEPSMGVGNFLGMMPPEIRSKVQAVGNDKDTVTTGIAKLLYPEAAIYNKPYEDLILPNNEMDLTISNVPFFEVPVYDPNYPKMKAMLHDYFFLKSMDKVKPGGLVAFITSTGTMDRQRSDIREALAAQGDLVAAFRLPSTAFKANAGTDVTTDLIILRKRLPGEEPGGEEWMKAIPTKVPIEEDRRKLHELTVNEYYQKHPENLLGTPVASKNMYSSLRYSLSKPERPIEELLKEALERLPKNIIKAAARPTGVTQADTEAVFAVDESLEYSYHIDDKGNIRQKREGKSVPAQAVLDKAGMKQPAKVERMKAMIRLRQSLNDLMYHMKTLPDDEESNSQIKVLREALSNQYKGFVNKFGLLNSVGNNVFREDPHYPRLLALEHYDKAKKQGTPADIFQKRTIYPRQSLSSVSQDPTEALQQILAERGYADIDLMAQLQGKTPKEAAETLIKSRVLFRDPITGEYATKEKYLSGYVRTKLDDAKAAVAQGQNEYKANVEELEKVQPEYLHITDSPETSISVRLGGTWIPIPALEKFFKDTLKTEGTFEYNDGTWAVEAENARTPEITNQWATRRANAVTLLQDSLNLKQTTIYDTDGEKTWVNADETTAARAMQERMRQEFQKWALESKEWKEPLEKAYNYAFNNLAETEYDGSFLTFPGMNPEIKLKSHQVNAVWRIIQEGRALLAHEVGAGKTFEMVASVMEGRRTGVFKKPMIAVPNHIVDQFRKEFMQLYPGANILVPTEKDFDSKNRQRIMSQIATGDYDCVLLPHSQFNLMDISAERQKKTIQGEMDELDETLRGAIEADPEFKGMTLEEVEAKVGRDKGKRGKNQTVKELVKSRLKFKERLKELSDLKADTAINFDDTGVDALFIDEAHEYKNLKYFTKMQRISGLQQANSKRSFRLLAKLQYLQEVNNGRGVVFATGTPVQNTMAELYTMMKYVAPDVLERAGIKYFDDWAANFGSVITAMELSADGRSFKARSKFARFQNVPELMRMFRAFADVKTAADLNLPRPELEGGEPIVVTVPGSEKLDEVVKDLMERAEEVRAGRVRPDEDNMLKITSEGRKAATDLRLLDKEIKDEQESKINVAVKQMLMEYRAGQDDKLTQMAFLDMYRSMDEKENELINLYKDMKAKLVAGGVPAEEIAIVGDYKTRAKRQALFDQVNKGEVRILLGSTQKMGSGTNAQKRLKALHHIDLTWRPGDLTQREGRILRQGNTNKSVRIYNYLTERSFDAYMAQTLQSKAEFLSQILSGRSASRTVTDAAADMVLSLEEMKVAASGNPDIKKKYDLEMRLAQLQTVERAFDASKRDAHFQAENIESSIRRAQDEIRRLEKSQDRIDAVKGKDGEGYSMEVDGKKFTNRKDAIEYIKAMRMPAVRFYMKVNGVEAAVDPTGTNREYDPEKDNGKGKDKGGNVDVPAVAYDLEFEQSSQHFHNNRVPNYTMESVVLSIEARLRAVPNLIERNVQAIKDGEDQKPQFQKLADRKDFPERKELDKTREELKEVEKRLGLGNVNAGSQADKEETAAEVDTSKEPEVEEPEDEDDDEVEDGPEVTPGDTPPTKPEPPSDLNTFYTGFLDPALFKRLFPDVVARTAQWAGDAVTPGDDQRAMMRETRGQMDRRVAIAIFKLRDAAKEWRTRPRAESIDFWNAVENGRIATLSPKDQALAQVFKAAFDQMKGDIQKLKPEALQNYIENYFPHIWEQSAQVGKAIKGVLTDKKPLAGKGGFLKRRTIPTMQDGLDMGFTPKSWNPVDLFVLKYAEMAQFLMGHQTLQVMKDSGTAKFVRLGQKAPDGWTQLDDKISTVHRRVKVLDDDKLDDVTQPLTYPGGKRKIPGAFSEDIEDATHGELALVGHYYAPADAAKIFNNFVSKGIAGRSSIYDTLRWLNDNLNGLQLGISAFHATVTTVNAAASDIALGIEQLMQGKPVKAGASMVSGAAILPTLFRTIRNGSKLMREYLSPGSHAKMAKEANAIAEAGGRVTQNSIELSPFDKAINAFRNGAFLEGLSAVPGAILHGLTYPVLGYYVPKMKVGAFYYMAHNILDEAERKNWNSEMIRTRMQEAWDSIDDRFGQVVYDNLFWHKGLRDALHLTVRAVGYTYGDIRTYGGAAIDTAKAAVQITKGKKPRVTPRMAFAVGSFLSTALLGGVMTFLWTGHAPQTWKDYTHPRDTAGQRHTIPGYPDQMISAAHDPVQWVLNKQAPIWSAFGEMARNQDYDRTEIRHKDDSDVKQVAEVAEWAGKQAIPFSFTNTAKLLEQRGALPSLASMLHEAEKHPGDLALGQLGFQSAPAFIQNSAALNKAREYVRENAPPGTKTKEQADKTRAMHAVEDMYRTGEVDQATIQELRREHMISQVDVLKARLHAKQDPLVRLAKSLSPDQALHVWNLADDKERRELRPTIELKSREIQTKIMDPAKRNDLHKQYREALHGKAVQLRPGSA